MLLYCYYLLGLVGLVCSLVLVTPFNPVHRIAVLVVLFLVGSLFYIILDFYFLGLTFIIVYCGAIAILFVFVIMMVKVIDADINLSSSRGLISAALLLTLILPADFFQILPYGPVNFFLPNFPTEFLSLTDIHLFAIMVYFAYPTALIIIGIALWVVMVGIMKLTYTAYH